MDEIKKFELLPDQEKIKIMKFYEMFSTVVPDSQLDAKAESASMKPTAKQKTLDGWLLKSKETSGQNINSGTKICAETVRTNAENVESRNLSDSSEINFQNNKCSDSEILEVRQDNTFKQTKTPDFISNEGTIHSGIKLILTENVAKTSENVTNTTEKISPFAENKTETSKFNQGIAHKHHFTKKNPYVLVKRLDFTNISVDYLSETGSPNSSRKKSDDGSQVKDLSKADAQVEKTPMPSSSTDENSDAAEKSPLEVGNTGVLSCDEKQREAYHKLKKLCLNHGLELDDIFQAPEFKEMIEKYKSLSGAILFIGSHKCATSGKVKPTVNIHKSKKKLLEVLSALKTRIN